MISPYDMNDAVTEAQRCSTELGFGAVFLRENPLVRHQWHDPYYEPLWSAIEDLNIALGFHESTGTGKQQIGERLEPNLMLAESMLSRWNKCWLWEVFAPAIPGIPKLSITFSGCRSATTISEIFFGIIAPHTTGCDSGATSQR